MAPEMLPCCFDFRGLSDGRTVMVKLHRTAIMFVIIAAIALPGAASAETTSQTVNLTVVSRCGASIMLEKAGISTEDGRTSVDMPLTRVGLFFYTGRAPVAPGHYHVGALVRGATARHDCWGGSEITVLPGHDRNVGIEVTPLGAAHYDAHAFLYGTLPFEGFVRGTLVGKSYELPVEVGGGAYYAEHEFPGSYVLKLSYGDSLECRIPVVIPEQGLRLDINVQQAQQCLGFPYHLPATGERGFVPIFPSPSPSP